MKTATKIKNKQKRLYTQIAQIEAEGYKVSDSTKRAIANLTKTQTGADKQKFTYRDLKRASTWGITSLRSNATREIVINQFRSSKAHEIKVTPDKALRIPVKYHEPEAVAYARFLNARVPRTIKTGGALATAIDVVNIAAPELSTTRDKNGMVSAKHFKINIPKLTKALKDPSFNDTAYNKHLYNVARNQNVSPEGVEAANTRSHEQRLGTYKLNSLQMVTLDDLVRESWVWDHYFTVYDSEQAKEKIQTDIRDAEDLRDSDYMKDNIDELITIINNNDGNGFEKFVRKLVNASRHGQS